MCSCAEPLQRLPTAGPISAGGSAASSSPTTHRSRCGSREPRRSTVGVPGAGAFRLPERRLVRAAGSHDGRGDGGATRARSRGRTQRRALHGRAHGAPRRCPRAAGRVAGRSAGERRTDDVDDPRMQHRDRRPPTAAGRRGRHDRQRALRADRATPRLWRHCPRRATDGPRPRPRHSTRLPPRSRRRPV